MGGIETRRARPGDGEAIARVHVAAWRSAYPGILPDRVLVGLSAPRLAPAYEASIRSQRSVVLVGCAEDGEVVAFATGSVCRGGPCPGDGEIETLYVLDDWRERGLGRALLGRAARALRERGCGAVFANVLSDNPSRWFYERLGAVASGVSTTRVGGRAVAQTTMRWADVGRLLAAEGMGGA